MGDIRKLEIGKGKYTLNKRKLNGKPAQILDLTEKIRLSKEGNLSVFEGNEEFLDEELNNLIISTIDNIIEQGIEDYQKEDTTPRKYHKITIEIWEIMYKIAGGIEESLSQVADDYELEMDNEYILLAIKNNLLDYKVKVYEILKEKLK